MPGLLFLISASVFFDVLLSEVWRESATRSRRTCGSSSRLTTLRIKQTAANPHLPPPLELLMPLASILITARNYSTRIRCRLALYRCMMTCTISFQAEIDINGQCHNYSNCRRTCRHSVSRGIFPLHPHSLRCVEEVLSFIEDDSIGNVLVIIVALG